MKRFVWFAVSLFAAVVLLQAQSEVPNKELPDGPGKEIILHTCARCHLPISFLQYHHDEGEWAGLVGQMAPRARISEEEEAVLIEYFSANMPKKVNVNKASAGDLEILGLTPEESKAIVAYRTAHGDFKTVEDLQKVQGVDSKKIDAAKDKIEF